MLTQKFQLNNSIICKCTNVENQVTMKQKFTSENDLVHIRII